MQDFEFWDEDPIIKMNSLCGLCSLRVCEVPELWMLPFSGSSKVASLKSGMATGRVCSLRSQQTANTESTFSFEAKKCICSLCSGFLLACFKVVGFKNISHINNLYFYINIQACLVGYRERWGKVSQLCAQAGQREKKHHSWVTAGVWKWG